MQHFHVVTQHVSKQSSDLLHKLILQAAIIDKLLQLT